MSLHAQWVDTYKKELGKYIFVYAISGPSDKMEGYRSVMGQYYREMEDGRAKFFSPFYVGKNGNLMITKDESRYFLDSQELIKVLSISEQIGVDLFLELYKLSKDLNWILHVQNIKIMDKNKYEKFYARNGEEYERILSLGRTLDSNINVKEISIGLSVKGNKMDDKGNQLDIGNEWNFAADVVQRLQNDKEFVTYQIVEELSAIEEDFIGTVRDEDGNLYEIRGDENGWMFRELLGIFKLALIHNFEKKTLKLGANLNFND
jgi:hypothetical protein